MALGQSEGIEGMDFGPLRGRSAFGSDQPGCSHSFSPEATRRHGICDRRVAVSDAQIFVEVDKRGRVDKASIEDADSEEIASAAMKNAKQCTYAPHVNDGRPVAFASLLVYVTPPLQPPPRK